MEPKLLAAHLLELQGLEAFSPLFVPPSYSLDCAPTVSTGATSERSYARKHDDDAVQYRTFRPIPSSLSQAEDLELCLAPWVGCSFAAGCETSARNGSVCSVFPEFTALNLFVSEETLSLRQASGI